jgi:hypothetical protein
LKYSWRKFLVVVAICRGARYTLIAFIAFHYGRHFVRALRNPGQYYAWIVAIVIVLAGIIVTTVLMRRRLAAS